MEAAAHSPGQGAQRPGMMKDPIDARPAARELSGTVLALLGRDLYALTMEGPGEGLDRTGNAMACGSAVPRVYRQLGLPWGAAAAGQGARPPDAAGRARDGRGRAGPFPVCRAQGQGGRDRCGDVPVQAFKNPIRCEGRV